MRQKEEIRDGFLKSKKVSALTVVSQVLMEKLCLEAFFEIREGFSCSDEVGGLIRKAVMFVCRQVVYQQRDLVQRAVFAPFMKGNVNTIFFFFAAGIR